MLSWTSAGAKATGNMPQATCPIFPSLLVLTKSGTQVKLVSLSSTIPPDIIFTPNQSKPLLMSCFLSSFWSAGCILHTSGQTTHIPTTLGSQVATALTGAGPEGLQPPGSPPCQQASLVSWWHPLLCICLLSPDQALQILADLIRKARARNIGTLHPSFNLGRSLREGLEEVLPDNVHQLVSGKICISLTRVSDGENVLVSDFQSKEEVVDVSYLLI